MIPPCHLLNVIILISIFSMSSSCRQGKDMTSYARSLLKSLKVSNGHSGSSSTLNLPMRYIAGVHLYRGTITGLDHFELIRDEPIKLFCLNDTMAALQTKMMAR